jgi:peptidoglycan-associated lipoprotein
MRREAEERERSSAAEIARARETLTDVIYFEYDSEQLTAEAENRLRTKASILRANPSVELRVEGHADERGSTEYNLALGQRRAESVKNFIVGYGIEGGRVATISYGEEQPAVEGDSESAWSRNRRAEFEMTAGQITSVPSEVR